MSYRLKRSESLLDGVCRVTDEQLARAVDELADEQLDRHETVHQVRKRFKKVRSLLRLVRAGPGGRHSTENHWFRDAGRELSRVRDVESMLEAVASLRRRDQGSLDDAILAGLEGSLRARRNEVADAWSDLDRHLQELAAQLQRKREDLKGWSIEGDDSQLVMAGLARCYRRGRKTMHKTQSDPRNDRLHEWRKRCKDHWYHARLLRNLWPAVMKTRVDLCSRLCDLLGDDHDLAVLTAWLDSHPEGRDPRTGRLALAEIIDGRRRELREEAFPLGSRLFAEEPACLRVRFAAYWKLWKT